MNRDNVLLIVTIVMVILLMGFQLGRTYQANTIQREMVEQTGHPMIYSGNMTVHAGGHKVHVVDMRGGGRP